MSQRDSQRAQAPEKNSTLMFHTDSAPGLALHMPHRRRGLGSPPPYLHRDCASSGLPRILRRLLVSWSFVPVRGARAFRRNIQNQHRRVWSIVPTVDDVYRCHDGTANVLRFDCDGRPKKPLGLSARAIRALRYLVVACYSSPPMGARPWDELTNGTPAANIAYVAFVNPRSR